MKNWDDLRFFVAVAREGSLLAAARNLRVNPATVSRRIDRLEQALGRRLFHRSNMGYTISEDGERILGHAQALESEIFDLDRTAADNEDLGGVVTVTLTEALAESFLIPLLPGLRAHYPGIRIDLIRDDRSLNLSRREADIALRLVRPKQDGLMQRKIGELGFGLYATPAYLKENGTLQNQRQLSRHRVIVWIDDYAGLGPIAWWRQAVPQPPVFRSNSPSCRRAAAIEGLGIALLPCVMAESEPILRRVLPDLNIPPLDIWLVVHRDLARHPRFRTVIDFIADQAHRRATLRGAD